MSAQTGHIEALAPVLARQPGSAESDLRKHSIQRAAWADRRLSPPARRSRNDLNCQPQQDRGAFASAPIADRSSGVLLLPLVAILVMVGDVIVVGAVGRLWILIPAIAVDLVVIFTLTVAILRLLGDDGEDVTTTMLDERPVASAMPVAAAVPPDHDAWARSPAEDGEPGARAHATPASA
jgi:hypothetical protein